METQVQRQFHSIQARLKGKILCIILSQFLPSPKSHFLMQSKFSTSKEFFFLSVSKNRKDIPSCLPPEYKLQGL